MIAPSILSADLAKIGDEIQFVDATGADMIQVDVMDGYFVPSITLDAPVIKKLRPNSDKPFGVHLMITPVNQYETVAKYDRRKILL